MRSYRRRSILFAAGLALLAGYVDAVGFLGMGGFFVSFMSGNSTRLGAGAAAGVEPVALIAGSLILLFVLGVMLGSGVGRVVREESRARIVLLLVAALLLLAAIGPFGPVSTMALLAMAMGAANTVFERNREVSVPVTYMTGTLVRLGQNLTSALFGGPGLAWIRYLLLWSALVGGAIGGAASYGRFGLAGIWIAVATALALATVAPLAAIGEAD